MLGLKDYQELDDYNYKVCEISSCEEEADDIHETEDRIIDVCMSHYRQLENSHYFW